VARLHIDLTVQDPHVERVRGLEEPELQSVQVRELVSVGIDLAEVGVTLETHQLHVQRLERLPGKDHWTVRVHEPLIHVQIELIPGLVPFVLGQCVEFRLLRKVGVVVLHVVMRCEGL